MRAARGSRSLRRTLSAGLLCCIALTGCGPSDPLAAARQQIAAGQYQASLEPLRQILAERKGDPEVDYLYGLALSRLGQASLAEWPLREAMKDPKWLVRAGAQLVHGALVTRNFPVAIEAATRVLEVEPENVDVLLMRANAYAYSRMNPEPALADAEHVLKLDPDNLDAMEPKILSLLALNRIDEAAAAIKDLGKRIKEKDAGPELSGWYCATAALFAQESGKADEAATRWADCVKRFPGHMNVVTNAVDYYDSQRNFDRSLEILRQAQKENPDSRELRVLLAERLRRSGKAGEAEALLKAATQSDSPLLSAAAWIDLAKHYEDLEDYDASAQAAQKAYERARGHGEMHPQLLFEYADALVMDGKLDRARELADQMTVPAYQEMTRARVAQESGHPAEALEHYDKAFQFWPDNPFARYAAARAAEAVGNFDRAIDEYRYALRISPGATDARLRLGRLQTREGHFADALTMLRLRAEEQPLPLEGQLLSLYLWARIGQEKMVRRALSAFARQAPAQLGPAVAEAARGLHDRAGAAAAARFIEEAASEGLDLTQPRCADALRALVRFSHEAGDGKQAESRVSAALKAHPDAAALHDVQGLQLELGGDALRARAAYQRAVDLDPKDADALQGLGRVAGDPQQALAWFDRALEQKPGDSAAVRGAAAALARAGKPEQAEARLEAQLAEDPADPAVVEQLVKLQLDRNAVTDRSLELANRAVRFGGGAEALDLLSQVHERRGESAEASQAAERARNLRDKQLQERQGG